GRSDFCVSDKPELVFAKDKLAEFCTEQAIPFVGYENFSDLTQSLKNALPGFNRHHESAPRYATA
ncbi:MAG: phosphoserine phosphatase, partial [Phyllobacterium sp.]|nr:phosphoserine phosphatase [Phyllobacterium sp.]